MINRSWMATACASLALVHMAGQVQADTVIAICKPGGCECSLSPLSSDEIFAFAGEVFGADTPVDATRDTLVIEPNLGIASWVDAPRADINSSFGGTDECPITLFPEPDAMVPLDGIWQWRSLGETTTGCPPMMAAGLAAARVETPSSRVVWDGAFQPQRLAESLPHPEMSGMSPYEWRQIGRYRWISDNIRSRECGDGTCVELALDLHMTLATPERITGILSLNSRIDGPQAAILAGFGMAQCRVRVQYRIDRIAP